MVFPHKRFGYHVVYDRDIFDAIDFASRHGFGYIVPDLTIPRFWPENYQSSERRKIRKYAHDLGVSISLHGPSLDLFAPYPEFRRGMLERMKLCLGLAVDLEADRFTIHPSQPPNFSSAGKPGTYLEDHRNLYANSFRESIKAITSMSRSAQICIENDPLTPFVENVIENLMMELETLFLTLDIPKANDPSKGSPLDRVEAFFRRNIHRVREVHLHNRRPGKHLHDALQFGEVDITKYMRLVAPYDVNYTFEIRPREQARMSLLWLESKWNDLLK